MVNHLQCAAEMTNQHAYHTLVHHNHYPNNTGFWKAFRRHFPPLRLILKYNTLQAQSSFYKSKRWDCIYYFFLAPFPLWTWLLLFIWRTRRAAWLGTWRSSVSKTGWGWCVPWLWSEPLTDVISSINLLTFARPRQWESMKRNSTEATTDKRKKILKRKCP